MSQLLSAARHAHQHLFLVSLILSLATVSFGQTRSANEYVRSGAAHLQAGEFSAAIEDADRALALNPRSVDAYAIRAFARTGQGDFDGAHADYTSVIGLVPRAPGMEKIYNNRGFIRTSRGDLTGALEDFNQAIKLNPNYEDGYTGRAVIRLQQGEPLLARADYDKAIALNPKNIPALGSRGGLRMLDGDLDGDLSDFDRAIDALPNNAIFLVLRGITYGLKGNLAAAITDVKQGAALDPSSISDTKRGNFSSPFGDLNDVIKANPKNARGYEIRGLLRLMQKRPNEAENDFSRSLEIAPELEGEIRWIKARYGSK